jgi:hypothetical protein
MGTTHSTQSQANATHEQLIPASDAPESVPPNIGFASPHFLPAPSNILVIESYSSMGGPSLGYALLYSPHVDSGGIAITSSGRMCNVPPRRWEEIENLVRQAKEVSEQLRQSSWSRPQTVSATEWDSVFSSHSSIRRARVPPLSIMILGRPRTIPNYTVFTGQLIKFPLRTS